MQNPKNTLREPPSKVIHFIHETNKSPSKIIHFIHEANKSS